VTQKSLFETALLEATPLERSESVAVRSAPPGAGVGDTRERQQRHLTAARRLSRRIARLPDHSAAQLRAGRMICRHLVAMLKEAAAASEPTAH
jgi:hypothetical protein